MRTPRNRRSPATVAVVGASLALGTALLSAPSTPDVASASGTLQVPDTVAVPEVRSEALPDTGLLFSDEEIDAALRRARPVQELLAIYRRIDGLRDVQVRHEGGVLELTGTALSPEDRDRAAELAAELPGVIYVDNRIEVERSLTGRMAPAAERFREKGTAFLQFLPVLLVGFLIVVLTFLAAGVAGRVSVPYDWITRNPFANNLLRHAARAVVVLTGLLLALELLGATALVGAVLGTAGLAGLAIGFAFRDIVENYLAGVILSLRQPFAPQDHIEIAGHEGQIVRLTGRETVLMTLDGNHVRIPNSTVFKDVMTNFTRNPRRRFTVRVGVAPWEDLSRALEVGRTTLHGLPGVLEHPAVAARVHELGDSSVELRFFGWVDQTDADFGKVRSEAVRAVKEAFEREGIATPPPEYGVRMLERGDEEQSPAPSAPPPRAAPSEGPTAQADISRDTTIEEEIARELADSPEENLLEP